MIALGCPRRPENPSTRERGGTLNPTLDLGRFFALLVFLLAPDLDRSRESRAGEQRGHRHSDGEPELECDEQRAKGGSRGHRKYRRYYNRVPLKKRLAAEK